MENKERLEFTSNVGEAEQWVSVLGGLALGWYGLTRGARLRRSLQTGVLAAGGLLIARGLVGHCAVYRALGLDSVSGPARTRLEHAVTVHRPAEEVYQFWHNVENWPLFMPHLKSITRAGRNRLHWSLKGPAGATVTWDAAITDERPNERIAWESLAQSGGSDRGVVRFRTVVPGQTEVRLRLDYSPSAGPVGVATERALSGDPEHRVREQLEQFKRLIESRN